MQQRLGGPVADTAPQVIGHFNLFRSATLSIFAASLSPPFAKPRTRPSNRLQAGAYPTFPSATETFSHRAASSPPE